MKNTLRHIAKRILGYTRYHSTLQTKKDLVARLVKSLRPKSPPKPLIRLGPVGDGGYLVPDDLEGITACYSPGVSKISGFENDCAERGIQVFMADKSVDGPATQHEKFRFLKKYIGAVTTEDFISMDDWVRSTMSDATSDLILQMDIEGYEFDALLSMPSNLFRRFRIIVAEFHGLDNFWSKPFCQLASSAFAKILEHHTCVHVHPNNCCGVFRKYGLELPRVVEITFLRNDRLPADAPYTSTFPNPLDSDNTKNRTLPLPECWYRPSGR